MNHITRFCARIALALAVISGVASASVSLAYANSYPTPSSGYTFSTDLTLGSSGDDVSALQNFLIAQGYSIPAIKNGTIAAGYFGSQTRSALMKYQAYVHINSTGFFGPLTRTYINKYHTDISPIGAFNIVKPNGGESWQAGTTQNITWNAPQFLRATYVDISFARKFICTTQVCPMIAFAPQVIASHISIDNHAYSWTIPTTTAGGDYSIQICETSTSICTASNKTFTILASGSNPVNTPTISGLDAPTTLSLNQVGTWTVHASDPNNSALSYSVDWGDTNTCPAGFSCMMTPETQAALAVTQTSTFTHAYANAGTYTVTFTVKNNAGLSTQTTTTVLVSAGITTLPGQGTLTITSPNGSESWYSNSVHAITWNYSGPSNTYNVDISLQYQPPACPVGFMCTQMMLAPVSIAKNIPATQRQYTWDINSTAINTYNGNYKMNICFSGTNNCSVSDTPFTIMQPQVPTPATTY